MPGTLADTQPDDNLTEFNRSSALEINMTTIASVSSTVEPTTKVSILIVGSTPFYTVIGGGIIVLAFSFIIVCVLICYSVQRKRKSHTFTTAATLQAHNGIQTQGMM